MDTSTEKLVTPNESNYRNRCMEEVSERALICNVPPHRLDDRIRELCARVVAAEGDDLPPAISDLKAALREHNNRLRKLAASTLGFLWSSQKEPSVKDPNQSA